MAERSRKKRTQKEPINDDEIKISEIAKKIVEKKKKSIKKKVKDAIDADKIVKKTRTKKTTTSPRKRSSRKKSVVIDIASLNSETKIESSTIDLPKEFANEQLSQSKIIEKPNQSYSSSPVMQKLSGYREFELPWGYNETKITVMVRDPHWIHSYWEIPDWKIDELKSLMGHSVFAHSKRIIRVYDVTGKKFTGVNANKSFDIEVGETARNWYINTNGPNRSYCVDIGYLTPEGKFYVAARSNIVSTPPDSMSDIVDEEWVTIDWERIYSLSGGFGIGRSSGEIRELLKKRLREEMSSGVMFGSAGASDFRRPISQKEKDFWLVVNTELIVYGATEPDATVTVQGLPIKLRQDGTFTLRFALPDGRQEIPVVAINKDGDMKRQITPSVEKRTK